MDLPPRAQEVITTLKLAKWGSVITYGGSAFLAISLHGKFPTLGEWCFIFSLMLQLTYLTIQESVYLLNQQALPFGILSIPLSYNKHTAKVVERTVAASAMLLSLLADYLVETFPIIFLVTLGDLYFGRLLLRQIQSESSVRNLLVALFVAIPFILPALLLRDLQHTILAFQLGLASASIAWIREMIKEQYEVAEPVLSEKEGKSRLFPTIRLLLGLLFGVAVFILAAVLMFNSLRPIPSLALVLTTISIVIMVADLLLSPTPQRAHRIQLNLMKTIRLMLVVFIYDTIIAFLHI